MTSNLFPSRPELDFNMEQVGIKLWDGRHLLPYCNVTSIKKKRSENTLELVLRGNLNNLDGLPYLLKLKFTSEHLRVKIEGEMLELPSNVKLTAFNTCFMSHQFSDENHPPFEMARKSFAFFEGKGFSWISDAERGRSEYHQGSDDGGPWIQLFRTAKHADSSLSWSSSNDLALPLVGWVAGSSAYMILVASENAYHVGIRWGPCLHSDVASETDTGKANPRFKSVVYIIPVDMKLLLKMYKEDFNAESQWMSISEDALWPYTPGILLGNFEDEDLKTWHVNEGTLKPYKSEGTWINGNLEKIAYPEGITEGKGSAIWEVPVGKKEATLSRFIKFNGDCPISHLTFDAINRGKGDVEIDVSIEVERRVVARKSFTLRYWANQRFLLHIPEKAKIDGLNLILKIRNQEEPAKIVLDNLKGFYQVK
ncbi:hypothetical protein KEJ18_00560 [Candidatus Bathyarchaeota archaeon]|nr:hypothetical protein [Candidatus Bathyarchaeota archaeon]